MKKRNRLGALLLTAAISAVTLAGCAGGKSPAGGSGTSTDGESSGGGSGHQIGYVNLADTDVFCMAREAAVTEAIKGSDYSVSFSDGNNDNQKQID